MPRRIFPAGSVTNTSGLPLRLTFHYTQTGSARSGDLWTLDGSNYPATAIPNGVIITDASGNYSAFAGPDDVDFLWVQPHTGDPRTQVTATATVANGTTVDSATYVRSAKPLEQQPHTVFGHSYSTISGRGLWHARLAARQNMGTVTNRGVAGYLMTQTLAAIQANWTANTGGLISIISVLNDVYQYGPGSTSGIATCREAFRTCLAYLTASAVLPYSNASAFAFGANWTSGATTTNGSYVDFTFLGDSAWLLVTFTNGAGSTVTITSAGTTVKTFTTGGYQTNFTGAVKLSGFGVGSHTLRITVTTGTSLTVVGAAFPLDTPAPVLWYPEPAVLGYGNAKATSLTTEYIPACRTVLTDFPAVVALDSTSWDNATMLLADGIHPNDKGHSFIADKAEAAFAGLTFTQGLNYLTSSNAGTAYTGVSASDNFNRSDTTAGTLGTASDGTHAWTAGSVHYISGNTFQADTFAGFKFSSLDVGGTAYTAQLTSLTNLTSKDGGLAVRYVDDNNLFLVYSGVAGTAPGKYMIAKRTAGTFTFPYASGTIPAVGDVVKVVVTSTSVALYVNSILLGTVTDSAFNTSTKIAIGSGGNVANFDDLIVS